MKAGLEGVLGCVFVFAAKKGEIAWKNQDLTGKSASSFETQWNDKRILVAGGIVLVIDPNTNTSVPIQSENRRVERNFANAFLDQVFYNNTDRAQMQRDINSAIIGDMLN